VKLHMCPKTPPLSWEKFCTEAPLYSIELLVRHELMEAFQYQHVKLFDPHRTVRQLGLGLNAEEGALYMLDRADEFIQNFGKSNNADTYKTLETLKEWVDDVRTKITGGAS